MRTPHPDPRPTAPRPHAVPLGGLRAALADRLAHPFAVLALAPLVLASCTDDVAVKCPPLRHPEVLTVAAAAGNPCAAQAGESAAVLALRVVRTYQRTSPPTPGAPTRYPLRCGDRRGGYLHLLDQLSKGNVDHGDPVNDPEFDAEVAFTIEHGAVVVQNNNNLRLTVRYDDLQRGCHSNRWGFRVVLATNAPPFPPPDWQSDGLPIGVITAFRLPDQPAS